MDLTDTLSGWEAMTDTTAASGFIPPSSSEISSSSIVGGRTPFSSNVPTFLTAGGDVLSGFGSYLKGQETAGADEYNASLALMMGEFNVDQLDSEEEYTLSTQKAMFAKAGVEQSGSVLDTALSTATQFEYSKQIAEFNAKSAANMDEYKAKMAKSQGEFGLASGLLKGAGALLPLAFSL